MIEILTQGGYHELTIPDCMELFNAWLEADYEQQGNLYDLVDKLRNLQDRLSGGRYLDHIMRCIVHFLPDSFWDRAMEWIVFLREMMSSLFIIVK